MDNSPLKSTKRMQRTKRTLATTRPHKDGIGILIDYVKSIDKRVTKLERNYTKLERNYTKLEKEMEELKRKIK